VAVFSFPRRPRTDPSNAATACALTFGEIRRHILTDAKA